MRRARFIYIVYGIYPLIHGQDFGAPETHALGASEHVGQPVTGPAGPTARAAKRRPPSPGPDAAGMDAVHQAQRRPGRPPPVAGIAVAVAYGNSRISLIIGSKLQASLV